MILLGLNNHKNTDLKDSSKCHGRPVTGHISLKSKALGPMPTGWRKSMKAHSSSLAGIIARPRPQTTPPKISFEWQQSCRCHQKEEYIYIYAHTCKLYSYIIRWTCLKKHSRLISSLDPPPPLLIGKFSKTKGLILVSGGLWSDFFPPNSRVFFWNPHAKPANVFSSASSWMLRGNVI